MATNLATLGARGWGPGSSLTDLNGNTWSITQSGQVAENGVVDPHTSRVYQLYEDNSGNIFQMNADDNWWEWTPGAGYFGWTGSAQPFTANPSPNATVVPNSSGEIFDSHENIWSISNGGQVVIDNVVDQQTKNVVLLVYINGVIWQENNQALWWEKATPGGAWTPGPAPVGAGAVMSYTGKIVYRGGSDISDAQGNVWQITSAGQVMLNDKVDTNTSGVIEMVFDGQRVWQENSNDLWWSWQPSTPGNYGGWYPSAGTATVPVPFGPTASGTESFFGVTDNSDNLWRITNGQVAVDNIVDASTANVIQLALVNGRVYQENYSGLWWSKAKPSDSWAPGAGSPTDPVTGKTTFGTIEGWAGGHSNNSASDAANWSANILPQAGMSLLMLGGTMNMSGGNLAGDELLFNSQSQDGGSPTVNLSNNASLTAGTSTFGGATPTINVSGSDTLNLSTAFPGGLRATVNLAAGSHLFNSDGMVFGSLTVNGAAGAEFTMTGTSGFSGTSVLLNTPTVDGTGTIKIGSAQSLIGNMEITGSVGNGLTFDIGSDPERGTSSLTLDEPGQFHGAVNMAWSTVLLKGLSADSYDIKNDLLTLFKGNSAVASFDVTAQPILVTPTSLLIKQEASGVVLGVHSSNGDTGGTGAPLPLHV